jgi:hypothetical protein
VLLGNDLADYLPGLHRLQSEEEDVSNPADGFVKPKKKRKGKGQAEDRQPKDEILLRLGESDMAVSASVADSVASTAHVKSFLDEIAGNKSSGFRSRFSLP